MTTNTQGAAAPPEALRLADIADDESWAFVIGVRKEIAAELRRLHALAAGQATAQQGAAYAALASHEQAPAEVSPTAGMNIPQRILHVGGRNNDAGYVEFGSIQAVEALVRQVLRDLPALALADSQPAPSPATATFLRGVIDLCTQKGFSPENIEAWDSNDKWIADIWRQARELLAAQADTQPAPVVDEAFDCARAALNHCLDRASIAHILDTLRTRMDKAVLAAARAPADPQLLKFYGVTTDAELIAAQARHIERLQAKLPQTQSFAPQRVREG